MHDNLRDMLVSWLGNFMCSNCYEDLQPAELLQLQLDAPQHQLPLEEVSLGTAVNELLTRMGMGPGERAAAVRQHSQMQRDHLAWQHQRQRKLQQLQEAREKLQTYQHVEANSPIRLTLSANISAEQRAAVLQAQGEAAVLQFITSQQAVADLQGQVFDLPQWLSAASPHQQYVEQQEQVERRASEQLSEQCEQLATQHRQAEETCQQQQAGKIMRVQQLLTQKQLALAAGDMEEAATAAAALEQEATTVAAAGLQDVAEGNNDEDERADQQQPQTQQATEPCISGRQYVQLAQACVAYYQESGRQLVQRMPFGNPGLLTLAKMVPCKVQAAPLSVIDDLARRFPQIIKASELPQLEQEFRTFKVSKAVRMELQRLQAEVAAAASGSRRMALDLQVTACEFYCTISRMVDTSGRKRQWPLLSRLFLGLLCLPHANADVERLFSALNLVKSRLRNRLLQQTVKYLLMCKVNEPRFDMILNTWLPSPTFIVLGSR
jgi:hypothetical protein